MATKSKKYPHAFFERNSWHYRTKVLQEDYSVKYGKVGGFQTAEEAEQAYRAHMEEFERAKEMRMLSQDKEITLKSYLLYWFESIYSVRIKGTTRYLSSYVLDTFLMPNIDEKIALKFVSTDYLDRLLMQASRYCESAGNKSRELLYTAMKDAVAVQLLKSNPVKGTQKYPRKKSKIRLPSKSQIKTVLEVEKNRNWFLEIILGLYCGLRKGDADGKISLNQQKPSNHAGLRRFGPEKFLQRNNEFMKERPIFYKNPIKIEKDFSTWLRCFYYTTKAVITEYIYF